MGLGLERRPPEAAGKSRPYVGDISSDLRKTFAAEILISGLVVFLSAEVVKTAVAAGERTPLLLRPEAAHVDTGTAHQLKSVGQTVFLGVDHAAYAGLNDEFGALNARCVGDI